MIEPIHSIVGLCKFLFWEIDSLFALNAVCRGFVLSEVGRIAKRFLAHLTLVRFVAVVDVHVHLEAGRLRVRLIADGALVRFVAGVSVFVGLQAGHLAERFAAHLALERTPTVVGGHVQLQVGKLRVGLFAFVALVRFVAVVHIHVDLHAGQLVELFRAHFALELLAVDVNLHVSGKVALLAIGLAANRAEERLLGGRWWWLWWRFSRRRHGRNYSRRSGNDLDLDGCGEHRRQRWRWSLDDYFRWRHNDQRVAGRDVSAQLSLFVVRITADVTLKRGQLNAVLIRVVIMDVHVNAQVLQQCEWFLADFTFEGWPTLAGHQDRRCLAATAAALSQGRDLVHLEGGVEVLQSDVAQPQHSLVVQAARAVHIVDQVEVGVFVVSGNAKAV